MKEQQRKVELERVDTTNDAQMVAEGIRLPNLTPRDESIWTKTPKEKKELKRWRRMKFDIPRPWPTSHAKSINVPGTLVVYVNGISVKNPNWRPNTKSPRMIPKTTFSHKCMQSDIAYIVGKYKGERSAVLKYSWNGKTYSPDVLPFWYGN